MSGSEKKAKQTSDSIIGVHQIFRTELEDKYLFLLSTINTDSFNNSININGLAAQKNRRPGRFKSDRRKSRITRLGDDAHLSLTRLLLSPAACVA